MLKILGTNQSGKRSRRRIMDTTSGIVHGYSDSVRRKLSFAFVWTCVPSVCVCRLMTIISTGSGVTYTTMIWDLTSYNRATNNIKLTKLKQNILDEFEGDPFAGSRIRCEISKNQFESDHFVLHIIACYKLYSLSIQICYFLTIQKVKHQERNWKQFQILTGTESAQLAIRTWRLCVIFLLHVAVWPLVWLFPRARLTSQSLLIFCSIS